MVMWRGFQEGFQMILSYIHTPILFMNFLCLMLKGISFNITVPIKLNYLPPLHLGVSGVA